METMTTKKTEGGKSHESVKKRLLKNPKLREEYEKPDELFDEGSYFTWIASNGHGSRSNEKIFMPCHATVVRRKGNILTVIIDDHD